MLVIVLSSLIDGKILINRNGFIHLKMWILQLGYLDFFFIIIIIIIIITTTTTTTITIIKDFTYLF